MDELERLDDEFNFPNSARAELHVQIFGRDFAFDSALDRGDFIKQFGSGTSRKNERLMVSQKLVSESFAAARAPRFDQGEALPCFTKAGVVILHALKGTRERAG